MTTAETAQRQRAASLADLRAAGRMVVHLDGHTICLIHEQGGVHAVDNRCPHMGFPLHRGSVSDGILTCHWHHARFDLCTAAPSTSGPTTCAASRSWSRATTSTST
jgi:nitrite reductase/ring-hydroxylating ferredoxin subunit